MEFQLNVLSRLVPNHIAVFKGFTNMKVAEGRARQKIKNGYSSLTEKERMILSWSPQQRLEEFQKVNQGVAKEVLETKLMYIDSITFDNAEILEILKLSPTLSWEKVRDIFLGGPADGYTSTFHSLDDIAYPEFFWKALIENERDKL